MLCSLSLSSHFAIPLSAPHKMSHKRKRAWTVEQPSGQMRSFEQHTWARKEREQYKRARIRELLEQDLTKDDLDERRERYYCMKEHPGRFCSECNPRAEEDEEGSSDEKDEEGPSDEDDEGPSDEEDDGGPIDAKDHEGLSNEKGRRGLNNETDHRDLSDEEAEIDDSWSDGTSSSGGGRSPTYSELWDEEEEKLEVTKYIKDKIAIVEAAAARLEALLDSQVSAKPPIGGLKGQWDLYNLDVCPKCHGPTDEYYRFFVPKESAEGQLPSRESMTHEPYKTFIEWSIKNSDGDIVPFQFPAHASTEAVPIQLMRGASHEVPAEIVFLGRDCLRLRVPRSIVYPKESDQIGDSAQMIEFAGIRETEADIAKRKKEREERVQRNSSPRESWGASFYR